MLGWLVTRHASRDASGLGATGLAVANELLVIERCCCCQQTLSLSIIHMTMLLRFPRGYLNVLPLFGVFFLCDSTGEQPVSR